MGYPDDFESQTNATLPAKSGFVSTRTVQLSSGRNSPQREGSFRGDQPQNEGWDGGPGRWPINDEGYNAFGRFPSGDMPWPPPSRLTSVRRQPNYKDDSNLPSGSVGDFRTGLGHMGPGMVVSSDEKNPKGSSMYDLPEKNPSNDNVSYIVIPIVVTAIVVFVLFKTWPKLKNRLKSFLKRRGLLKFSADSGIVVEKSVHFKTSQHNMLHQAQTHLEKITVGSANVELSQTVLGRGEYGLVTKGYATGLLGFPPRTVVAVKTLIRPTDPKQRACFLKEMETMMVIGRHLNIVNLLGTVVEGNPMLILEFCANGSLKRHLKKQRADLFYNHVSPDGSLLPFDDRELQTKQTLMDQRINGIYGPDAYEHSCQVLSTRDLIIMAYQIARGLEYLASHSIIHRDIAARNILVNDRNIVKLSDFGLAKQWTNDLFVTEKNFDNPMPIKWMAPEAILRKTFSQKSDVWAFGILLHELFSLGGDPYPDFTVQGQVMEFIAKINEGLRMLRPTYFPDDLYVKLAIKCFEIDPADRPAFTQIRQTLDDFIPLTRQEEYLEMGQEYEAFNEMFGAMSNNAYVDLNYESINNNNKKY